MAGGSQMQPAISHAYRDQEVTVIAALKTLYYVYPTKKKSTQQRFFCLTLGAHAQRWLL
jgi:hypothetical protein